MTPDEERKQREDQIAERIKFEALELKKHKRRNSENNTDDAIRERNDFDPHSGE